MKKHIIIICLVIAIFLLCACEPITTTYGEIVHDAVKEHYSSYEILDLIQIKKDRKPTAYYFCVVDDLQSGIDILWMVGVQNENDDFEMESTIITNNIELNKEYSTTNEKQDLTVEYLICEKKDVPNSVLKKEKIKFNEDILYFCITSITQTTD